MVEARFVEMPIRYLYRGRIGCGGNFSEIPNSSLRWAGFVIYFVIVAVKAPVLPASQNKTTAPYWRK